MSDEWMDLKAEAMTHEQAVEAVKELRKVVADNAEILWKNQSAIKKANDDGKSVSSKPPLGCKPAYISSPERIVELSKAITRQAEDTCNEQLIRRWATEILYHCEILEKC